MAVALDEAAKAREGGNMAVGAVIVRNGEVLARGHNEVATTFDVTAHAEAVAVRNLTMARRALRRKEEGAAAALERILCLYRGDFLDGEPAGDWHIEHSDRLQRTFVDSLMELGAQFTADDRHAKAADVYRRVLARCSDHR